MTKNIIQENNNYKYIQIDINIYTYYGVQVSFNAITEQSAINIFKKENKLVTDDADGIFKSFLVKNKEDFINILKLINEDEDLDYEGAFREYDEITDFYHINGIDKLIKLLDDDENYQNLFQNICFLEKLKRNGDFYFFSENSSEFEFILSTEDDLSAWVLKPQEFEKFAFKTYVSNGFYPNEALYNVNDEEIKIIEKNDRIAKLKEKLEFLKKQNYSLEQELISCRESIKQIELELEKD